MLYICMLVMHVCMYKTTLSIYRQVRHDAAPASILHAVVVRKRIAQVLGVCSAATTEWLLCMCFCVSGAQSSNAVCEEEMRA